jgi:nicotinamide phosphoribosyltransferase
MIRTRKLNEQEARMYAELISIKEILANFPTGIVSYVSDTYDLWKVCSEIFPLIKNEILSRNGKLVIRPDSGDPVDIVCGTIKQEWQNEQATLPQEKGVVELLWDIFGGTVNSKGYKVLDSHIGVIYGDSISRERAESICQRLADKGFASSNIVFGVGSYTYNYNTRDSLGIAIKSTYCEVDGVPREIFKDPVTDNGIKKSARGLLKVESLNEEYILQDRVSQNEENSGELKEIYVDGKLLKDYTLSEIRERLESKMKN